MRNLNVAVRLGFSFGLVLFLMMVAVGMALYAIRDAQDHASALERENLAMLNAANAMRGAQLTEAVAIRDFVGQKHVERQTAAFKALGASEKAYAEAAGQLEKLVAGEDADSRLRALVTKLKRANAPISARLRDAMQLSDQAGYVPAQAIVYDEVRPLQAAIAADLEALVDASNALARQRAEAGRASAHRTELLLVAVALAALALGIAATWIITRGIARPLAFAVKVAQRVAEGDLRDMAIRARRNDETGRVLTTLAGMQGRLGLLVRAIRESADAVGGASERISARNTELAARTEEQAASLEETAASVEELTAVVKQNADSAGKASELASEASTLAQDSGEAVTGVRQRMERIQKSSRNVSDIVGVMDEIAFQTNLLALNAAVEAARAGEHGRGFGVVAAQVRTLAQRSGDAARDIKKLVADAVGEADHGARAAERAGESMARVVQVAQDLARLVSGIARGSEEQRAGIEQVNTTIAQMDTATQSNAALVQEINDFIDGLLTQARELAQATSRFRLEAAAH